MAISFHLAAIVSIALFLYYSFRQTKLSWSRYQLKRRNGCLPAKNLPQLDPWLGTDVVLANLRAAKKYGFLALLKSRHDRMGLTFTTQTYFRTTVNTCDPELIKTVLSLQFEDFGMGPLRRRSAGPLLGRGIFTTDDDIWAHQRALIRPSFVKVQLTDFSIFDHHVNQLIQLIRRENYVVDLQQLFFRMVLDSNSNYMFGESVGLMSGEASEAATTFHHALDYAQQGTILRLRLGNLMPFHRDRKFRDACDTVHAYAEQFVTKALQYRREVRKLGPEKIPEDDSFKKKENYVFLNELAKDTDDPILLRDQIVNMLLAARDTTAGLLAFVFFQLARRPDIWEKLRANVLEHYCEPLTYETVMEMTYLRYVIHEALRMFPPIATNSRMANKDCVIPVGGGHDGKSPLFLKKNNVITYSTFVMHRRKEFFGEDAEEFHPERWEKLRPGWEFLPFNGGPRICPGQKFAITESSYTIARLLHTFSGIENLDPTEWREQLTLSLTLNNGVKCRLIPDEGFVGGR